ncbi:Hsp20/alpha crystallin family protein [Dokdonella fugitiva]|jgi:HSP20 family protein|uniref:HSP20 family protein n=1 Tax=Dokdonella fugitiva TaxID=328517 RepID=A0A4R2IE37_9GAMM|nr:Hsp20/alpha crystallin family protein [Dokdonella fugitiva]MBA8883869.1 HSP20 family protein [Dokdonella fugitiva]TCO41858.1 HSP20 family protein [Dokdonella fugitiva]
MIVTHYNPWFVRGNVHAKQALDRFFNGGQSAAQAEAEAHWTPRVDVREEAERFVILADLPGVDPATIEVQMDKNVLSLKGERAAETLADGAKATRVERAHGRFDRRFVLPDSADADGIRASGKHGVVEITIPKKAQSAPRRIAING